LKFIFSITELEISSSILFMSGIRSKIRYINKQGIFFNVSQATWSMELFGKFSKRNCHILREKVMKSSRFLEDLGKFLAYF
jgi:hypothetical protein